MQRRKSLDPSAVLGTRNTATKRGEAASKALLHRAQQWLTARERLIAMWLTRAGQRARVSLRIITSRPSSPTLSRGVAHSPVAPRWWEYESELKRRLALEMLLRRLFSLVPAQPPVPVRQANRSM